MNDSILSRQAVADDARTAAERREASGADQINPHLPDTEAWRLWDVTYRRHCSDLHDCDGGA